MNIVSVYGGNFLFCFKFGIMMLVKGYVMYYLNVFCIGNVLMIYCIFMNSKSNNNNENLSWFEYDINGFRIMKSILKYCLIVLII